ncbi:hypothetical protein EN866_34575 [Mesorhizobium sp. M2D.F.Ca.ET.223.01.1.1]|uniref:portal protein n=1 Tax=Mesorhizobium sp. M2D.F.Ca.ET.223.01.1.1 TaxID=2563940 RepID=UPI001091F43F|nr:hypothetical protein [Mesorhizobium sp. M2D.F.Ca.ET.223.01.1.1]TGR82799.1 hypothetical protein EN866_34575 [Mesorhizobium sp. M2D.F.Ca.ET.223.01.1.1]TGT64490.1 hypothetical protein EN802_32395 [bacterium M00.F.Ca.ET.159.01.1.1]TGT79335.1 hypothetical protein EN800_31735 [bacterium M00.F.Ca.ET.157.01.1.1]
MAKGERMDEEDIKALLAQEIQNSVAFTETELSGTRARALEYYRGVMTDTPAANNRSSVVSRDVADTIGWMLPGIIRVFSASDHMAEYEPYGPNDEEFAKQATDYCNYVFWKDNNGYRVLWDATHDSLLLGNGIVKHWWDDKEECEYSELSGLTAEQIAILQAAQGVEVTAQKAGEPQIVMMQDATGQMVEQQIPVFDVKMKRVTRAGRLRIKCIAGEDFLKDRDSIDIEDARFTAHRDEVTRSDLVEMGFDPAEVDELPAYRHSGLQEERQARDPNFDVTSDTNDKAMQLIELYECYLKVDVDGDGIAETIRAFYAGSGGSGRLLDWEVWDDDVPFSDIPCEPVPHRWDARSVADETMDTQRVKTVLTRQFLDNLYWVNNPMSMVEDGAVVNPEMMAAPVFGGTIRLKKGTMVPPTQLPIPFIGDKALMGLEHFDQVTEKRTGVSRSTMALDPETLQNQSATANQNQKDASYSQVELIARNMAELGWKRVFKMILRLLVKHQDRPRTIRIRDKWVDMDPRFWNTNMDVTINVGLGTGTRDRDMAMLNNILTTQTMLTGQLAQTGFANDALDMLPKIIKTATKLAESSGIRNPDEFYIQIDENKLQEMKQQAAQPKVDPALQLEQAKVQAQMQLEQAKMQMASQLEGAKAQAAVQKEQAQMQADLQVKMAELQKSEAAQAQQNQFDQIKLAEESRQKQLDREHQMQIEMMKLDAQKQMHRESAMLTAHTNEQNNQVKRDTAKQKASAK